MIRLARLVWTVTINSLVGLAVGIAVTWAALWALGGSTGVLGWAGKRLAASASGVVTAFTTALGVPPEVELAGLPIGAPSPTPGTAGAALALVAGPVSAVAVLGWLAARMSVRHRVPPALALAGSVPVFAGLVSATVALLGPADIGLVSLRVAPLTVAAVAAGWALLVGGLVTWWRVAQRHGDRRRRRARRAAATTVVLLATLLTPTAAVADPAPTPGPKDYRRPGVAEAMDALRAEHPESWRAAVDPYRGVPSALTLRSPLGTDVRSWLRAHSALFGFQDVTVVLRQTVDEVDPLGRRHVWFRQVVGDVPVEYANLGVHIDRTGRYVTMLTNALRPDLAPEPGQAARGAAAAAAVARRDMPNGTSAKAPALFMMPLAGARPGKAVRAILVWSVRLSDSEAGRSVEYLVAARGPERVVRTRNLVREVLWRTIYDLEHKGSYTGGVLRRVEGDGPSNIQDVDDVYFRAGNVYNYWRLVLGRDSWNDRGWGMVSKVRLGKNYQNAGWLGDLQFTYFGDDMTKLDVVAHEWQHAVTQDVFTDNVGERLIYERESGALSESISDAFAEAIENWMRGSNNWLLASETKYGALRNLRNPGEYGQPGHMDDYKAKCLNDDHGGVHTNSGIPNRAFVLLSDNVGVGVAARILWWTIVGGQYGLLAARASFADFRIQQIAAAEDLFGRGSVQAIAVMAAWHDVGVEDETVAPVADTCTCALTTSLGIAPDGTGGGPLDQQIYLDMHNLLDLANTDASIVLTHYSRAFLAGSDRMSELMNANPALKQQFRDVVYELYPIAQTLIGSGSSPPPVITADHVAHANALFDALAAADQAAGGNGLAALIATERARVDLNQLAGRDALGAQAYLQTLLAES